jgi:hypothetical protein
MTDTNIDQLTNAIQAREAEVAQYQQNIVMYQAILGTLPTEWPENLIRYRGVSSQHDAISVIENMEDVELISQLWYADDCNKLIRTETLEMTKSNAILQALRAQLS